MWFLYWEDIPSGVSGSGFHARDVTFRNVAGPGGHQAVALRAAADLLVFFRCSFEGYQDTLYALSGRQLYRECRVYGTVDFVFGNAIALFQGCALVARPPLPGQSNTVTAQGRKLPADVSGFVLDNCSVDAAAGLPPGVDTFLGRPWKAYSRVVVLRSQLSSAVSPAGWAPWNSSFPFIDTLFYGEFGNSGAGSDTGRRVAWPGVHPALSPDQAAQFSPDSFLAATSWVYPNDAGFSS
jgi:pectinesterase